MGRQDSWSSEKQQGVQRGGEMLLTSSSLGLPGPGSGVLGQQAGALPSQASRVDGSHGSLAVPENKEIATQTTRKPTPGVGQF